MLINKPNNNTVKTVGAFVDFDTGAPQGLLWLRNPMSNKVTKQQVKHLATLANLVLSDEQIEKFQGDLSSIINYMDEMKQLQLDKVESTFRTTEEENVLRDDVVIDSFSQSDALKNTKKQYKGFFVVDRILENKDE